MNRRINCDAVFVAAEILFLPYLEMCACEQSLVQGDVDFRAKLREKPEDGGSGFTLPVTGIGISFRAPTRQNAGLFPVGDHSEGWTLRRFTDYLVAVLPNGGADPHVDSSLPFASRDLV